MYDHEKTPVEILLLQRKADDADQHRRELLHAVRIREGQLGELQSLRAELDDRIRLHQEQLLALEEAQAGRDARIREQGEEIDRLGRLNDQQAVRLVPLENASKALQECNARQVLTIAALNRELEEARAETYERREDPSSTAPCAPPSPGTIVNTLSLDPLSDGAVGYA